MLYISSDHAGYELKKQVLEVCSKNEIEIKDLNPEYDAKDDYPDSAVILAEKIKGTKDDGIAICGTSQGICMAMNRHPWIRAGIVDGPEITKQIKRHNHANVICIPGPYSGKDFSDEQILEIIKAFLETLPDTDQRHTRRVDKLSSIR